MENKNTCVDIDGNVLNEGDKVEVFSLVGKPESKIGESTIWCIEDMNENQTNMPYIKRVGNSSGAWNPKALRKIKKKEPTFLRSPSCDCGCSCHINPPCSHCTDHVLLLDTLDELEKQELIEEGWTYGH